MPLSSMPDTMSQNADVKIMQPREVVPVTQGATDHTKVYVIAAAVIIVVSLVLAVTTITGLAVADGTQQLGNNFLSLTLFIIGAALLYGAVRSRK